MKPRAIAFYFASIFLFFSYAANAQTPNASASSPSTKHGQYTASISGTVFDPDGRIVAGARITLLYAMAALEVRETDAQGKYEFDDLRAGTYQLVGTLPGFNEVTGE